MDTTAIAPTLETAPSFAEFKRLKAEGVKAGAGAATIEPVEIPTEPSGQADDEPVSGTAGESETPSQDNQEPKEKKDRSANARFAQLTRERKEADERAASEKRRADDLEQKLRTGTRSPEPEKPAATPKEARPNYSSDPDYPKEADFETMAELIEARAEFRALKTIEAREAKKVADGAAAQAKEREETVRKTVGERIEAAKQKYPDWDEKMAAVAGITLNDGVVAALNKLPTTGDIRYHLASNVSEFERINAMSPQDAYDEVVGLHFLLSAKPAGIPDKPTAPVPVRRPPPLHPQVGGVSASVPELDLSKAKSMKDFKEMRRRKSELSMRKTG